MLGMSVGSIQHEAAFLFDPDFPQTDERLRNLRPVSRQEAYAADVTYGTNNEFGFDYLRDNLVVDLGTPGAARPLLRDRRRGRQHPHRRGADAAHHLRSGRGVGRQVHPVRPPGPRLKAEEDYILDEKFKQVAITEAGTDKMERWLGVDNLFGDDFSTARHLDQALKAEVLYKRDRDYVVKDGEVIIVDEFTGRLMPGRRWSEGLHQAVEAKEGVKIQSESRTLATITFQNYFRMYDKLAGMTGTAETEAEEFAKIYELEVVVVPTNRPMVRGDFADLVYRSPEGQVGRGRRGDRGGARGGTPGPGRHGQRGGQRDARRDAEAARHQARRAERQVPREGGRDRCPGRALGRRDHRHQHGRPRHRHHPGRQPRGPGRRHPAPQGYQHPRGLSGGVRRRAGGGGPGLRRGPREGAGGRRAAHHRHRAARCATHRQPAARPLRPAGRPGQQPLLPLAGRRPDAPLRRRTGSARSCSGSDSTTTRPLESGMVSRTIEGAQTRVEGYNFDARKHVVQYDDVINRQRETIYHERERILRARDLGPTVLAMLEDEIRVAGRRARRRRLPRRLEPRRAEGAAAADGPHAAAGGAGPDRHGAQRHRPGRNARGHHGGRLRAQARRRPARRGWASSSGSCCCG